MAEFSTHNKAQAPTGVDNGKPKLTNTWQGAGAAEFDLRSMAQLQTPFEAHTDTRLVHCNTDANGVQAIQ